MKRHFVAFPLLIFFLVQILFLSCEQRAESNYPQPNSGLDSLIVEFNRIEADSLLSGSQKLILNKDLTNKARDLSDSMALELLAQRCGLYINQNKPDSALYTAQIMLERAVALGDSVFMAQAHFRLGYYHREANRLSSSLDHYYKSKELYIALKDSANAGRKLLNLANLLNAIGNYNEAEITAVEGLAFLENSELTRFIAGLYNVLAISAIGQKNYEDAIHWYQRALNISPRPITKINLRNNIARAYIELEDYQTAYSSLSQILNDELLLDEQYIRVRARVQDNLGHVKTRLSLPSAETDLSEALRLRILANYLPGQYVSYLHLEEFYREKNPAKAQSMAEKSYELALALRNPDDILWALSALIDLSENPKEYAQAYKRINDSITQSRQNAKNQYAKIRYESEENRRKAQDLAQESQLKSLELDKSRNENLLLVIGMILLLLASFFLYRLLQVRHRKKELQESLKAESRIAKKVHDELANDIYNIMAFTESGELANENNKEQLLNNLEKVYQKSRNISRSSAKIDSGVNFPFALKEMLNSFSTTETNVLIKGIDSIKWDGLESLKKETCYRVLQELMVNMRKHSQASVVLIEFEQFKNHIAINYTDNGVGLPENIPLKKGGLQNTENRIEAINGEITFDAELKRGFKSKITLR